MRILLTLVAVSALVLSACGDEGGSCVDACWELKEALEYQMPDLKLCCADPEWVSAGSCRECLDVLLDKTAASPVDEVEFCRQYYLGGG